MQPNILFIMTDQQRWDTIGPQSRLKYPHMEKLRNQSVSFDNFYISAAACVPSRTAFLLGQNAWLARCNGNRRFVMDGQEDSYLNRSWMQVLRDVGYQSISVGKTHQVHAGSFHIPVPLRQSFCSRDGWDHFHVEASPETEATFYDIQVAERTCEALQNLNREMPFALFAGFHAPHEPYVLPEKYLDFCHAEEVEVPTNNADNEYAAKSASYRRRKDHFRKLFGPAIDDEETIKRGIAGYYCSLKMIDDCIGRIMECLQEQQYLDNTIVVFTSDHGELLGEHGLFNKNATAYEAEVRIPFMIRFPDGSHAGLSVGNLACALDFFPTLMDLLQIDPDLPLPGYSLRPCLEQGTKVRDNVLIWHMESTMTMLTQENKIMYCPQDKDGELYDLRSDPQEMINLWTDPAAEKLKNQLLVKMLHERIWNDKRSSAMTKREIRLHSEIKASREPEVV